VSSYLTSYEKASSDNQNSILTGNRISQLNIARKLWKTAEGLRLPGKTETAGDARAFYFYQLKALLLPDCRSRLEQALNVSKTDTDTSSLLEHYLVLRGGASPQQIARAISWLLKDWGNAPLPGLNAVQREQLAKHLTSLLAEKQSENTILLNRALIHQVRAKLARQPQARRLLHKLLSEISPDKFLSGESDIDFSFQIRNESLIAPALPRRYNRQGYKQLQLNIAHQLPELLEIDDFIMGKPSGSVTPELTASVMKTYFADYIKYWDSYLSGLRFILPETGNGWGTWLEELALADSALFTLFKNVEQQTWLVPDFMGGMVYSDSGVDPVSRHFAVMHQILSQPAFNQNLQQALMSTARNMWLAEHDAEPPPEVNNDLAQSVAGAPHMLQPLLEQLLQGSRTGLQQLSRNRASEEGILMQAEQNQHGSMVVSGSSSAQQQSSQDAFYPLQYYPTYIYQERGASKR